MTMKIIYIYILLLEEVILKGQSGVGRRGCGKVGETKRKGGGEGKVGCGEVTVGKVGRKWGEGEWGVNRRRQGVGKKGRK